MPQSQFNSYFLMSQKKVEVFFFFFFTKQIRFLLKIMPPLEDNLGSPILIKNHATFKLDYLLHDRV